MFDVLVTWFVHDVLGRQRLTLFLRDTGIANPRCIMISVAGLTPAHVLDITSAEFDDALARAHSEPRDPTTGGFMHWPALNVDCVCDVVFADMPARHVNKLSAFGRQSDVRCHAVEFEAGSPAWHARIRRRNYVRENLDALLLELPDGIGQPC